MRNKKKNRIYFLLILLLGISIGFAALATTLKINGTANIGKNTWDVHWANVGDVQKSSTTTITTGATVDSNDNTKVNFEVTLNQPGDYYEFQVDAVNAGTLDAMANIVSKTTVPSYASLTVKYADGEEINKYDLLAKAPDPTATPPVYTTERVKVRIEFLSDIDPEDLEDIGDDESIDIVIDVPYDQADDNAKDRRAFAMQLGDYFTLVPDASTYTVTGESVGWKGYGNSDEYVDQTLVPNELTLWRVININNNGTYDAISEYVSNDYISMHGTTGYVNSIKVLQDIAAQYAKAGYTVGTRMFGYNGQTLTLSDTTPFSGDPSVAPSSTSTPSPTTGTGEEFSNGLLGDTLYLKDAQLVSAVYAGEGGFYGESGLGASMKDGTYACAYWVASRYYEYYNSNPSFYYRMRMINSSGNFETNYLRYYTGKNPYVDESVGHWTDGTMGMRVRPIITLKKEVIKASGTGVKTDPYIFD